MRAALALAGFLALACCHRTLPVLGQVPRFTLTAQTGEAFDSQSLQGKVWVADFIFTNCAGPCPRMTSQMHWLAGQVRDMGGVRFVSFTVDPDRDTPPVLATYARQFQADTSRWYFLTGPQPSLEQLDRAAFKLGDVGGPLMHSTRFVLVDARGQIRGYYDTADGDSLKSLIRDIRSLV